MGIVGLDLSFGIRMVSEWFPPKEIGIAEGIYGGWGNFGAFAAEFALPIVGVVTAFLSGGANNWRLARGRVEWSDSCCLWLRLFQQRPRYTTR
jgi:NNP family nitrate/nitrite transporter-like MFS transporter